MNTNEDAAHPGTSFSSNRLTYRLLVGILVSFAIIVWPLQKLSAEALRPIEVALGNWAPIIEEERPGHGALAEKITTVLRRMGYQPHFSFMPWGQAEETVKSNETDSGPRITFPHLKTAKRQELFLYSDKPVYQACMRFFYHKRKLGNSSTTRLVNLDDLDRYRIGYVVEQAGYQYPERLNNTLKSKGKSYDGIYDVFERLIADDDPEVQVVPAAQVVGEHLLMEFFPDSREKIGLLQEPSTGVENGCLLPVYYYLLVSRKNPNNAEFMDSFNRGYKAFENDKETLARIDRRERERSSLREPLVRLEGLPGNSRILADTQDGERIHVPRGSRGILLDWTPKRNTEDDLPHARATVRLINGPYRGLVVTLSGELLRIE